MRGDQIMALESGLPFALAAGDQDRLSWLVGQPIERALDWRHIAAASLRSSCARIGQHVGQVARMQLV